MSRHHLVWVWRTNGILYPNMSCVTEFSDANETRQNDFPFLGRIVDNTRLVLNLLDAILTHTNTHAPFVMNPIQLPLTMTGTFTDLTSRINGMTTYTH